jgi:hypothetical protein
MTRPIDVVRPGTALPGDVRRQVTDILFRTVVIALFIVGLDVVTSAIPQITVARFGDQTRADFVSGLFKFYSILPALLLALTSFAVTGLSPYGNPALILLYRWHRIRWFERPFLFFGRTNLLYRAMVLGLGLVLGLFLLQPSRSMGLSNNTVPTLLVVVILAALLSTSLVSLVLWVISLRRPSDVIQHTYLLGCDLFQHLERIKHGHGRLTTRTASDDSVDASRYEEQEDMKRCVNALTEAAIRSLELEQRLAASEATLALRRLDALAQTALLPLGWEKLGPNSEGRDDWLQELFVQAIESVVVAAVDLHYYSVGCLGAESLADIGIRLTDAKVNWPGRGRVFERTLEAFTNTIDECAAAKELEVGGLLLEGLHDVVTAAIKNPDLTPARGTLTARVVEMLTRSVIEDDIPSLRSALACLRKVCELETQPPVAEITTAILSLGAIALASRAHETGSVLVDYAALWFDPDGRRFEAVVRAWPPRDDFTPTKVPSYVTREYFQLFIVLAVTRSLAIKHHDGWQEAVVDATRDFTTGLADRTKRATVTIKRMGAVVRYPPDEVKAWVDQVKVLDQAAGPKGGEAGKQAEATIR